MTTSIGWTRLAAALALAGAALGAAANPATTVRQSSVHARPFVDAPVVTTLAVKQRVEIIGAQGAWNQVRTADGKTGWTRLLNLRPEVVKGGNALAGLAQLGNVARTGSTGAAATTGAKGITRDELQAAKPNPDEVAQLERYRAPVAEARQYAAMARLTAREVAPLPEPR